MSNLQGIGKKVEARRTPTPGFASLNRLNMSKKFFLLTPLVHAGKYKFSIQDWYLYAPVDTYGRYKRLKGFDVFQPTGFQSFGADINHASKTQKIHPKTIVQENVNHLLEQFDLMYTMDDGIDEKREPLLNSEPEYYKWTQFVFGRESKAMLAVKRKSILLNYCDKCKELFDNDECSTNRCPKCKSSTNLKMSKQWYFKTSDPTMVERLKGGLALTNFPEKVKMAQAEALREVKDWRISRQYSWGCPIPVASKGGKTSLITKKLPWLLPNDIDFFHQGLGDSFEFVNRSDFLEEGWEPLTEVLDSEVDLSFFWFQALAMNKKRKKSDNPYVDGWLPVHLYVCGSESNKNHLLRARFIHKVLLDQKVMPQSIGLEPFQSILNPSEIDVYDDPSKIVAEFGSDEFRMALMSLGEYAQSKVSIRDKVKLIEMEEFLNKVKQYAQKRSFGSLSSFCVPHLNRVLHTVDKLTEKFKFNLAIQNLISFFDMIEKESENFSPTEFCNFLIALWSYAPKTVDKIWTDLQEFHPVLFSRSPSQQSYPEYYGDCVGNHIKIFVDGVYSAGLEVEPFQFEISPSADERQILSRATSLVGISKTADYKYKENGLFFSKAKPKEKLNSLYVYVGEKYMLEHVSINFDQPAHEIAEAMAKKLNLPKNTPYKFNEKLIQATEKKVVKRTYLTFAKSVSGKKYCDVYVNNLKISGFLERIQIEDETYNHLDLVRDAQAIVRQHCKAPADSYRLSISDKYILFTLAKEKVGI